VRVECVDHMGSDMTVVNAARVSFSKESNFDDGGGVPTKDQKLINYLARHQHWTPFAHCFVQFRIQAPLFVARQLVKHQVGLTWNEVSMRYVDDEPEFYTPLSWRSKPEDSKQGSSGEAASQYFPSSFLEEVVTLAKENYEKMIRLGIAPEMARMILPQNMMTEWYWSGSLMAFARVVKQRTDPHTQLETQEIASQIGTYCHILFPHSWEALMEN